YMPLLLFFIFFFSHPATSYIYTLSLHDALPILVENPQFRSRARVKEYVNSIRSHILVEFGSQRRRNGEEMQRCVNLYISVRGDRDRKSTRLNSSHLVISYAVFCLKKKKHVKHQR